MGIDFKTPAEVVEDNGIKMCVYGHAGVGKTVLCTTTGAPTLMISAEAGLLSIKDAKNVSVIEVQSLAQVQEVFKHLRDNPREFEWVCLDSITEIADQVLAVEKLKNKDNLRGAYGDMANKVIPMIKAFRDLPMNVVFTAQLDLKKDEASGSMLYTVNAPGQQVSQKLPYHVDIVCAQRTILNQEGKLERWLLTQPDGQWSAKDRSGKLAMWEEPNLAALKAKVIAKKPAVKKAA